MSKKRRTYRPNRIATWDIETNRIGESSDPITPLYFKCGAFYANNHIFKTSCEKAFLDFFIDLSLFCPYDAIFAHNSGKFDAIWFFHALARHYPKQVHRFSPVFKGSRCIFFTFGQAMFADSFALIPTSLEKAGLSFVGRGKSGSHEDEGEELLKYCLEDCKLLFDVLCAFFGRIRDEGGTVGLTAASLALKTWQKMLRDSGRRWTQNRDYIDEERLCYAGGATIVFKKRAENYNVFDVNSMYPGVMRDIFVPIGRARKYTRNCHRYLKREGFAKVLIHSPERYAPPTWKVIDGKLKFICGYIEGIYALNELRYFIECGCTVERFDWIVVYSKKEQLFKEYVERFYELRKQAKAIGDNVGNALYKLLLNSLYGKFAESEERDEFIIDPDQRLAGVKQISGFESGIPIFSGKETVELSHVQPVVSAYITAGSRIHLHKLIVENEDSIIYCDTDSLHTTADYPISKELGDLDLDYRVVKGKYIAPKMYEVETTEGEVYKKSKGFRGLQNIEIGGSVTVDRVAGLRTVFRQQDKGFHSYRLTKVVKSEDNKRIFDEKGDSKPFYIDDR